MADVRAADTASEIAGGPGLGLTPDYEVSLESLNQWQIAWRRFKRHKLAVFGGFLFVAMILIAVVGPFILPFVSTNVPKPPAGGKCPDLATRLFSAGCPPTLAHPFGTTGGLGFDVLTLVVNGARLSLIIGVGASVFSAVIGTVVGGVAGYFGGWIDNLLMRVCDVLLSLPLLFVIVVASAFLGAGDGLLGQLFGAGSWLIVLIVFSGLGWPGLARLVRSLFLTLRQEVFVEAARAVGVGDLRIIFRHILPNAISPIIVATTLSVAGVIVGEAFVSYLGYGVSPTTPTWGNVLTASQDKMAQGNWWWPLFPGLGIVITVLGINFMGDGLRDALDPRSKL